MRLKIAFGVALLAATSMTSSACPHGDCTPSSAWKLVYQLSGLQAQYAAINAKDQDRSTSIWMDCKTSGSVSFTFADSLLDQNGHRLQVDAAYRLRFSTREHDISIHATGGAFSDQVVLQTKAIDDQPFLASLKKSRHFVLFVENDMQDIVLAIPFYGANLKKFYESCGI